LTCLLAKQPRTPCAPVNVLLVAPLQEAAWVGLAGAFFVPQPHDVTMPEKLSFVLLTIRTTYPLDPPVAIYSVDAALYDASGKYITCIDAFEGLDQEDLEEIVNFFGAPDETFLVVENLAEVKELLDKAFLTANLPPLTHKILDARQFGVPLEWFPRFFEENSEQVCLALR